MENILITGGAGFIPSSLADKILSTYSNAQVVLIDNFVTGKESNIPNHERCQFIEGDVNDFETLASIMRNTSFDYVFHYAALVGVIRTINNPIMVLDDIKGIENVLKLSVETKVKRIFYSSSSEVYGEPVSLPQHEYTTPLNSRLPYAVVKNVGEAYFRSYQQTHGLDYTIFRFFNTYGPKQSEDFVMAKFINAALKNEDITIYGDGSQSRTFCYINDNIDACLRTLEDESLKNDIFNIGNDSVITIKELAELIIRLTNSASKIVYLPALKEGDMTKRQPDITKMKVLLGRELLPIEDGIRKILEQSSIPLPFVK